MKIRGNVCTLSMFDTSKTGDGHKAVDLAWQSPRPQVCSPDGTRFQDPLPGFPRPTCGCRRGSKTEVVEFLVAWWVGFIVHAWSGGSLQAFVKTLAVIFFSPTFKAVCVRVQSGANVPLGIGLPT